LKRLAQDLLNAFFKRKEPKEEKLTRYGQKGGYGRIHNFGYFPSEPRKEKKKKELVCTHLSTTGVLRGEKVLIKDRCKKSGVNVKR